MDNNEPYETFAREEKKKEREREMQRKGQRENARARAQSMPPFLFLSHRERSVDEFAIPRGNAVSSSAGRFVLLPCRFVGIAGRRNLSASRDLARRDTPLLLFSSLFRFRRSFSFFSSSLPPSIRRTPALRALLILGDKIEGTRWTGHDGGRVLIVAENSLCAAG